MIRLNDNFSPVIEDKDLARVDGLAKFEQQLRLQATDNLYDVLQNYQSKDVPPKIRLEINRVARQSGIAERVESITVTRSTKEGKSGYDVVVQYIGSDSFDLLIEQ